MGMIDTISNLMNPQKMATDVASSAVDTVSEGASKVGHGIFGTLSGFAHGVMGSLWNGVKYTAILLGVRTLAPGVYLAALKAIKGPNAGNEMAAEIHHGSGIPGLFLDSATKGFGTAAVLGGIGGAFEGGGGGIAGTTGAALVLGTVTAVTIGAMHKGDVKLASNDGTTTVPVTPASKPKAEPAKG